MNENKLLGKFYSSGAPEDYNNNSYINFNNNYKINTNNNPSRNYSANINRNKISNDLPLIPSPYAVYNEFNRTRINYTPEIDKFRYIQSNLVNNSGDINDENVIMNYMKERMSEIERNFEEKRSKNQKELINLVIKNNNNINKNHYNNDIYKTENNSKSPIEIRNRKNNQFLNDNSLMIAPDEYYQSYYDVRNKQPKSEIIDNKFKKNIEKSVKSQIKLINNNLEKFKEDITTNIKKLVPKKKSKYDILFEEMNKLKEELNRKKDINLTQTPECIESNIIKENVKDNKVDKIKRKVEESTKNKEILDQIDDRLNNFKSIILTRIENIEKKEINIKETSNNINQNINFQKKSLSPINKTIIEGNSPVVNHRIKSSNEVNVKPILLDTSQIVNKRNKSSNELNVKVMPLDTEQIVNNRNKSSNEVNFNVMPLNTEQIVNNRNKSSNEVNFKVMPLDNEQIVNNRNKSSNEVNFKVLPLDTQQIVNNRNKSSNQVNVKVMPLDTSQVIDTYNNSNDDYLIKYTKPNKSEILQIVNELNVSKNKDIDIKLKNSKDRIKIDDYLKSIKTRNEELKQFLNKEKEVEISITEWKKSNLKTMKEKFQSKFSKEKNLILKTLKNISNISKLSFPMKKINKFRSVVFTVIASIRIERIFIENKKLIRLESLKTFVSYYESLDCSLQEWVFSSIRIPYLSIYNFENLDLDITKPESIFLENYDHKYIKLETRLNGFIDHLIEHTNEREIDKNSIKFLHLISSEYSYIPTEFFFKYEISRIDLKDCIIVQLNDNQRYLIIAFYVLIKILIINVFMENKFTSNLKNHRIKQNFKVISSVFYHTLINLFNELTPIISKKESIIINERRKEDRKTVIASKDNSSEALKIDNFTLNIEKTKDKTFNLIDQKYNEAFNYKDKNTENRKNSDNLEMHFLNIIRKKLPIYSNDDSNLEINTIRNRLLSKKDLSDYIRLANKHKFDLKGKILIWIKKIHSIIHPSNDK